MWYRPRNEVRYPLTNCNRNHRLRIERNLVQVIVPVHAQSHKEPKRYSQRGCDERQSRQPQCPLPRLSGLRETLDVVRLLFTREQAFSPLQIGFLHAVRVDSFLAETLEKPLVVLLLFGDRWLLLVDPY